VLKTSEIAISYYYIGVLDAPPESEWHGRDGTVSDIQRELKIKPGS
jgi:hypothetical protein